MKLRREQAKVIVPLDETVARLRAMIQSLQEEISLKVVPVKYAD
jgi:hypothetical protein